MVTIYENIYSTKPHYITISDALERIRNGKSRIKIEELRTTLDDAKQAALKNQLPSICFSGTFKERKDEKIVKHSGFIVLDFDKVSEMDVLAADLANKPFIYALWVSPRGTGLKALIRLADGKKHRQHFAALKQMFPEIDKSGVNESRVCYESYDPHIYINENSEIFTKILEVEKVPERNIIANETEIFKKLLRWITNKGGAFQSGERNIFIFKLASSCCRFGIEENNAAYLILSEFPVNNDFTTREAINTIKSAYRSNKSTYGNARFESETLVDKKSLKEVDIDISIFDTSILPKDVIYGAAVKGNAINIFNNGYEAVSGIGIKEFDKLFKSKRGEITGLLGIGNYGKSTLYKWMILMRILLYGEKVASFSPEDNPAEEYYHDFVEMLLGRDCTPTSKDKPSIEQYSNAYDFISRHVFYLYPQNNVPSPEYIKERFLELIIKEKTTQLCIDPFNQLAHDYKNVGGKIDTYLEYTLGDFSRFAQINNVALTIIAHPTKLGKQPNGNYPCPDVYDMSGGGMWNNKLDNILVYHRPFMQTEPMSQLCEFHSKKIRRQKTVGNRGVMLLDYVRTTRRYEINGHDYLSDVLRQYDMSFNKKETIVQDLQNERLKNFWDNEDLQNDYKN